MRALILHSVFALVLVLGGGVIAQEETTAGAPEETTAGDAATETEADTATDTASAVESGPTLEERVAALEGELESLRSLKLMDASTFRTYWKDGLRFDSGDGQFKLKLGGRIQNDWAWYSVGDDLEDAVGRVEDGTEFRRARLAMSGTAYGFLEFKAQYDFAGSDGAEFKDVYMGMKGIPLVHAVRVGHFKEPFGLEELTSSNYITFMERSLTSPFAPSRNTGAMAHRQVGSLLWQVGVFRDADGFGESQSDGDYNLTGRLVVAPINDYDRDRPVLVHLGGAYSYRRPNDEERRFRERPESHLSERFVDTGTFVADEENRFGLEAATVCGPLSLQGEFMYSTLNVSGNDPGFHAWYVMASYFLTGESRPYKASAGAFDRVRPNKNFWDGNGGAGAWELAARVSRIDLSDEGIDGGEMTDFTFGTNWYLNPNYRFMFNYVYSDVASLDEAHIGQIRFQVAF